MNKGRAYNEEELLELEFGDRSFTAEELAELDSDWGSSSDKFKHDNFQVARGPKSGAWLVDEKGVHGKVVKALEYWEMKHPRSECGRILNRNVFFSFLYCTIDFVGTRIL